MDIHIRCEDFKRGAYNSARIISRDSAGKGVNLSRALRSCGTESLCYMMLGREGYEDFIAPLEAYGMNIAYTLTDGRVRENMNIHHVGEETVISTAGPAVGKREVEDMLRVLSPYLSSDTVLAFCGSISSSSDKDAILSALHAVKSTGARLVIDSKSLEIEELLSLSPYLIKPNEKEAEALTGMSASDTESAVRVATAIRDMGCTKVLLTLGERGAVLASEECVLVAKVPQIDARSTVGAGDSTIAGFLAAKSAGVNDKGALATALAYGTAACMEEGSLPPKPDTVEELIARIVITDTSDIYKQ